MMCELATPFLTASSAEPIFGSMPPEITPLLTRSSIFFGVRPVSSRPSLSSTPGVLVMTISFSAPSTSASLPATRSALMLYVVPSAPVAIGATTGMKPPASSARMTDGLIDSISPTCPRSMRPFSFEERTILRARMKAPSWPVRPTALPPAWLTSSTTSLFTWPPSTISTTSMVSASVTRMPCTNSPFLPSRASSSSICGPPPCTTTGFMPTSLSSTTS
jgi:hypothetical protein